MKEQINYRMSESPVIKSDVSAAAVRHIIMMLLGFTASKATVKGIMFPFGLSLMAGVGRTYYPSVAIGVFIGYFFPSFTGNGFRYIASLFAILAIKYMMSPYKKISGNPFFAGGIALVATGITNTLTLDNTPATIAAFIGESFLSGAGAYFISRSRKALKGEFSGFTSEELTCILITVNIFIIGLEKISFYGISLGKIAGIWLLLTVSKYGGTLSGAVGGIALSFSSAISGNYNSSLFAYSLGGLTAGIFSPLGRFPQCAAVLASYIVDQSLSGFNEPFIKGFAEVIIAGTLFVLTPKNVSSYFGRIFALSPKISEKTGIKKALNLRLNMAADALKQVSLTTEKVSVELSKISTPDFGSIINGIELSVCKGCNRQMLCWEQKREQTVNAILDLTKSARGIEVSDDKHISELKGRCHRYDKLSQSTVRQYNEYVTALGAENRANELRSIICNQFNGMSDMLKNLAVDFENEETFDNSVAENVASALQNLDIYVKEAEAKSDKYGRVTVMLKVFKTPDLLINKRKIMKLASVAGEREFDVPTVKEIGDCIYISLFEHAEYKVDVGVCRIPAAENGISGDAYNYFNDGKGHFIMILSDGMGTGGRAAVDGAMASGLMSELLKAGFSYDCAVKLLNSAMCFKSSDESLATLDIASIDLFTAELTLLKAGAAPTVIRRNGNCGKAESTSLPIGILENTAFDRAKIRLKDKDIIVMCSDGATADGTDWIKAELELYKDGSSENLAKHLCESAKKRQYGGKSDDITVMTAIVEKTQ